jgi:cell division protein FtsB
MSRVYSLVESSLREEIKELRARNLALQREVARLREERADAEDATG